MIVAFSASADNMILAFIVIFLAGLSLAPALFAHFFYQSFLDWKIRILSTFIANLQNIII